MNDNKLPGQHGEQHRRSRGEVPIKEPLSRRMAVVLTLVERTEEAVKAEDWKVVRDYKAQVVDAEYDAPTVPVPLQPPAPAYPMPVMEQAIIDQNGGQNVVYDRTLHAEQARLAVEASQPDTVAGYVPNHPRLELAASDQGAGGTRPGRQEFPDGVDSRLQQIGYHQDPYMDMREAA